MKEAYPCSKAELIAENTFNFFRLFAQESISKPEIFYMCSAIPHPIFNCVLKCNIKNSNIEHILSEVDAYYKQKSIPFSWLVTELFEPNNITDILLDRKMKQVGRYAGLICDLRKATVQSSNKNENICKSLKIVSVTNTEELDDWIKPLQLCFDFSNTVTAGMLEAFKRLLIPARKKLEHFSVFFEGKRVGTGSLFFDTLSAGLYNLSVLPEYRNLGIASEIQKFRLQMAREKGYRYAVLQASTMAHSLDKKLGFEEGDIHFSFYAQEY